MSESLGLSIGVANLVAAHPGGAPVRRSAVVTLYERRATEVGVPQENPNLTEPGLVLRGFVERVGDPAPLVAADGTKYLGEVLTVEAIEAMARTVGSGTPITVAVPAYWSQAQVTALREEFFAQPDLASRGVPPLLLSDATTALAALRVGPGLPTAGVVVVCDFGAGGTSVTLSDAGSDFRQLAPSLHYTDFSGDGIDRLILGQVRRAAPEGDATMAMGSLTRLLGQCRYAKEQLSTAAAATVPGVPAASGDQARLTRADLEQLISEPLDSFLDTVAEALQRNGITRSRVAAVAVVGGGAEIPLITTRLSGRLGLPVLVAPKPGYSAAIGAALLGEQRAPAAVPTAAGPVVENPTEMVGAAPDDMTRAAGAVAGNPDGYQPVAWSQDADEEDNEEDVVPYTGPEYTGGYGREPRADDAGQDAPLPWYKRTALVLSLAGAGAAVLLAVLLALTLGRDKPGRPGPPTPTPTPQTVTVTGPNNSPTVSVIPPPSPSTAPTTTTAAAPSTSAPTTTTAPSTSAPTTTAPTTTTSAPVTTATTTATQAPTTTGTTATAPSTTEQAITTTPPAPTSDQATPSLEPTSGANAAAIDGQ
ncbi:Hsp70 family protein [Mycobacterium sp. Lab-001]|uniref:Hsp70 family protein n=1 Tax=Mycobacterium sp. Lab-001 TaxID=3410136 RepID=UPI003D179AE0